MLRSSRPSPSRSAFPPDGRDPNNPTWRSIEHSLERLGADHVDIVVVHDLAQDFSRDEWLDTFEEARKGFPRARPYRVGEGTVLAPGTDSWWGFHRSCSDGWFHIHFDPELLSAVEAARAVGYESPQALARVFGQAHGTTPSLWRRKHRGW